MSVGVDVSIERNRDFRGLRGLEVLNRAPLRIRSLTKEAVDDIADSMEELARGYAPGSLSERGVERNDSTTGVADPRASSFGGGFSARGAGGRFVAGGLGQGDLIFRANMNVPLEPRHAIWVHSGTGLFGPYRHPIVPKRKSHLVYHAYGRKWVRKSVRGQKPQLYLERAAREIETTYVPARLAILRSEIAAVS